MRLLFIDFTAVLIGYNVLQYAALCVIASLRENDVLANGLCIIKDEEYLLSEILIDLLV